VTTSIVWIAILSSVAMGLAGACVFVFGVKRNYFTNVEDAKYHVFWSDFEELVDGSGDERQPPRGPGQQEHDRGPTR